MAKKIDQKWKEPLEKLVEPYRDMLETTARLPIGYNCPLCPVVGHDCCCLPVFSI